MEKEEEEIGKVKKEEIKEEDKVEKKDEEIRDLFVLGLWPQKFSWVCSSHCMTRQTDRQADRRTGCFPQEAV